MSETRERNWFVVLAFAAHPADAVEESVDRLMDALMDNKLIHDPDITARESDGSIDVAVYVAAPSQPIAIQLAMRAVAEAVQRGGLAEGWDEAMGDVLETDDFQITVRPAELCDF